MGGTPSINLEIQNHMHLSYFTVQLTGSSKFRLILATDEIVEVTRDLLNSTWMIYKEKNRPGFVQFKLYGQPWYKTGEDDFEIKYFICKLIKLYYKCGWHLSASTDIRRKSNEIDTLFFHKSKRVDTQIICLSLNSSNKIRILAPEEVCPIITDSVISAWPKGLQREEMFGKSYELKLYGNPWYEWIGDGEEAFHVPNLILEIFENLFKNNWLFIGAIDSGKRKRSLNALYFRYAPDEISKHDVENTRFFCMTLNRSDSIRIYRPDETLKNIISDQNCGIQNLWSVGIQNQSELNNALEFKLCGNPWDSKYNITVDSKRLLNNLFNMYSRNGWKLYSSCDLAKHVLNKSVFFFRKTTNVTPRIVNFCISLNETNKIRLIDGDPSLVFEVKNAIRVGWPKGIQEESDYYKAIQLKLNGNPFDSSGSEKIYACVMMTLILNNLEKRGFKLLCSADVSQKSYSYKDTRYPTDLHSWFFEN